MFIKYIKRHFDNPITTIIIVMFIFAITSLTIYSINAKLPTNSYQLTSTDFSIQVSKYSNQEQLINQFNMFKLDVQEWKLKPYLSDLTETDINKNIKLYEFLIANKVEFKDIVPSGSEYLHSFNRLQFVYSSFDTIIFFLIPTFSYFFYLSFVSDFDNKSFIYFYNNKNRIEVLMKKILSAFASTTILFISFAILSLLFSFFLEGSFKYVFINSKNDISIINSYLYFFVYNLLFNILKFISFSFIFISIGLILRKGLYYILFVFSCISIMYIFDIFFPMYGFIFSLNRYFIDYSFSLIALWSIYISMMLSFVLVFLGSIYLFKKTDLV